MSFLSRVIVALRKRVARLADRLRPNQYWSRRPGIRTRFQLIFRALFTRPLHYSPEDVVSRLALRGVKQEMIRGEDLAFLYKSLPALEWSPSSITLENILSYTSSKSSSSNEKLWGVILEARDHPLLAASVLNVYENLQVPIQIYHGPSSLQSIMASGVGQLVETGKVVLTQLEVDSLYPPDSYNAFVLSKEFWYSMRAREKILFFQTDAFLCNSSNYAVDDFVEFDYIGSWWDTKRPNNLMIKGGCGGLSIRDWKKSVECIERFPPEFWEGGEDTYFGFLMAVMGAKVGDETSCFQFCTQGEFRLESFGAHKISDLNPDDLEAFLEYCPEAKAYVDSR